MTKKDDRVPNKNNRAIVPRSSHNRAIVPISSHNRAIVPGIGSNGGQ
jgi:hypothetical protein